MHHMYGIVLLVSLSNGADVAGWHEDSNPILAPGASSQRLNRHGRCGGGCGGHRGHRGGCGGCGSGGGCGYGGCGAGGCGSGGYTFGGYAGAPIYGGTPAQGGPERMPAPKSGKEDETSLPAPATIVVTLPADARLRVDDYLTTSTSSTRMFRSPKLPPDRAFTYTLSGEIVRDGKPVVVTREVTVRAGEQTQVTLNFPVASVAAK
jgi:uncharacterized protein (TIGR03000 family)